MSAYLVDREHVRYLVSAATSWDLCHGDPLAWVWDHDPEHGNYRSAELRRGDWKEAARVGQMLWHENARSVRHRYPDADPLPGALVADLAYGEHVETRQPITPARVLKACDGFEYQACEHPGWPGSEAKAFLDALRSAAWRQVDGYDAAPWAVTA